jgi:hypothetical protein
VILFSATTRAQPIWKKQLVAFKQSGIGPWRNHEQLKDKFHEKYPDDLQVLFSPLNNPGQNENMWVSIIEYDEDSNTYLGRLLNKPYFLKNVRQADNVIFKYDQSSKKAVAIPEGTSYWMAAVPKYVSEGYGKNLYKGLREYRLGNFGNNMPEIRKCIKTLSKFTKEVSKFEVKEDAFLAFFLLGRCSAEAYQTELAIESFKSAIDYNPDDIDANLALLAEYSIAVHPPDFKPKKKWEIAYSEHLSHLKENFSSNVKIKNVLDQLFKKKQLHEAEDLTDEEKEYRSAYDYGPFRYKVK